MKFSTLYGDIQGRVVTISAKPLTDTVAKLYANEAYEEFIRLSRCLMKTGQAVDITANTSKQSAPSDCIEIVHAEMDSLEVKIRSTNWMDQRKGQGWRMARGDQVTEIVIDRDGPKQFRVYPMLEEFPSLTASDISFETATALGEGYDKIKTVAEDFESAGFEATQVITTTSTTNPGPYKVKAVSTLYLQLEEADVLTAEAAGSEFIVKRPLLLDHLYWPASMSGDDDTPDFDQQFHRALFYFGVQRALRDQRSATKKENPYQAIIDEYLNIFAGYVEQAKADARAGFSEKTDHVVNLPYFA